MTAVAARKPKAAKKPARKPEPKPEQKPLRPAAQDTPDGYGDWWEAPRVSIQLLIRTLDRYHENEAAWWRSDIQADLARISRIIQKCQQAG